MHSVQTSLSSWIRAPAHTPTPAAGGAGAVTCATPPIGFHCASGSAPRGAKFPEFLTGLRSMLPMTACQIFVTSPKSFSHCSWSDETKARVKEYVETTGFQLYIHAPYLINACQWTGGGASNPDGEKIANLTANLLQSGSQMGALGVVIHVGKSLKLGEDVGLARMREFCLAVLDRAGPSGSRLLIETCAGQGTEVARNLKVFGKFIRELIATVGPDRVGVCVDTCHVFASGYKMADLSNVIKDSIGWEYVHLIHLNDSETACGARVDRHACIGEGKIGADDLAYFCKSVATEAPHAAFVFETPETTDGSSRLREMSWFASLFSS